MQPVYCDIFIYVAGRIGPIADSARFWLQKAPFVSYHYGVKIAVLVLGVTANCRSEYFAALPVFDADNH
jgi:hypothetical protein